MNEEQLSLFEDELPRLNDTEEALLHYMQKCMTLEEELKEVKEKIKELRAHVEDVVLINNEPDPYDNWHEGSMDTITINEQEY
jgi:archaellum component FlaC